MTVAYFDCFAGAAGDMIVGALLDAGADFEALKGELAKLGLAGCSLSAERAHRAGLAGTKFTVEPAHPDHGPHRRLNDIQELIARADLAPRVADRAGRIFTRLAEAEAAAHGIELQKVHFHEVGAVDSIMDVVGSCVCLELLGVDKVLCSPIPVGSGTIEAAHGVLPVPAPATAKLLAGAKTSSADIAGEATTPTAAAVLTTLAAGYGPMPAMHLSAVGYGAGTRETDPVANLLRVFIGQLDQAGQTDTVVEVSANIDDCTGEVLGATIDKLLAAGCVDAWATPIFTKKSRPAWTLSALCGPADVERCEEIIFRETTTFGLRRRTASRTKLARSYEAVETGYGPIRVKQGRRGETVITASPEFADCRAAAQAHDVSVREVMAAAMSAYRQGKP